MSLRESAETLYISVKTLEVHLGHAVQKIREALRKKNICCSVKNIPPFPVLNP